MLCTSHFVTFSMLQCWCSICFASVLRLTRYVAS